MNEADTATQIENRGREIFRENRAHVFRQTDRLFAYLMLFQWAAGIVCALLISPKTWVGTESSTHVHVLLAVFGGGLITSLPVILAFRAPAQPLTRHTIAVGQMLTSALLIHLTGGRIETHFHVFGSLAILAFYLDIKVLITATVVIAVDHLVRGVFWPQSVFGILTSSPWRAFEHAGWVLFENTFLTISIVRGVRAMRSVAEKRAELEITNRVVEAKVCERTVQLRHSMNQAEEANKAKSNFLANMSHEIRTPLNSILGFVHLLREGADDGDKETRDDWLRTVERSSHHLSSLINDILDLSKIEAGRLEVERIPCAPHQIFADVASILRVRAAEKGIQLELSYESPLPKVIHSDPTRLRQLLMNLVGNAVKFTDTGSVRMSAELVDVDGKQRLRIRIIDSGVGIAAEKLERIFDPFVQADNTVTRQFGGTGLGLAITKHIAESLGGSIRVTSEVGKGSTFEVDIDPGAIDDVEMIDNPTTESVCGSSARRKKGTIRIPGSVLLVEDGEANRKMLGLIMRRAGATVVTAENGQIGVELASNQHFDVIVMDMQMPVMDGYTATRTLRENGFTVPIIALTAHAMRGDEKRCLDAGCSNYLTKPVESEDLLAAIAKAFNSGSSSGSSDPKNESKRQIEAGIESNEAIVCELPIDDPEIREIVGEFLDELDTNLKAMRTAFDEEDIEAVGRGAHWLKGSGAVLGFSVLSEVAAKLQDYAREGDVDAVATGLKSLESLYSRISWKKAEPAAETSEA